MANQPTLLEQMGGLGGLVASTLPLVVLIPVNAKWGLMPALASALVVALAVLVWRLVRKENLQPAIAGFVGVAIGAAIAYWTGSAKGYFLYGIWLSMVYAAAFVISIVVRWPAVGVVWKGINGEGMAWRKVPGALRAYDYATAAWAVVFLARFLVQDKLYDHGSATALGAAKLLMGWPLTALAVLFTVLMVRRGDAAVERLKTEKDTQPIHD